MSIPLFARSRFLVTPPIHEDESLRGYVLRLALCNGSFAHMRPMLTSLSTVTASIPEISTLSDISAEVLETRGTSAFVRNSRTRGVRFGNVVLPENQVWMGVRKFCPLCLAEDGISRGYWELQHYSACHKHGIHMVCVCSDCNRTFMWNSGSPDSCTCGLHITKVETSRVHTYCKKAISRVVALSFNKCIQLRCTTQIGTDVRRIHSLDWTLLLIEFIRNVLIPEFLKQFSLSKAAINHFAVEYQIRSMLEDEAYCNLIRQAIFLHAAKDPMTLAKAITPGTSSEIIRYLGECIEDVPFFQDLWKLRCVASKRMINIDTVSQEELEPATRQRSKQDFWGQRNSGVQADAHWHSIGSAQSVDRKVLLACV